MIYVSIGLVIIASIAGFLVDKFLNQRQQEIDHKHQVNTESVSQTTTDALEEMHKHLDQRINKAFENHSVLKQEWESVKLSLGLKGNR